jgi:hypothetical protein
VITEYRAPIFDRSVATQKLINDIDIATAQAELNGVAIPTIILELLRKATFWSDLARERNIDLSALENVE